MAPFGRERTTEEWLKTFDEANRNGLLYLLLTGGEVFVRPDFYEIYSYAYNAGAVMSVNSNGTMIGNKQVEFFEKMPPEHINITVYGPDDETYEKLCCNPKGFSQMSKAVSLLSEAKIRFYMNCSVTPYNRDKLPQMIEFAKSHGCELNIASYMFPPIRKNTGCISEPQNIRLSPDECGELLAYLNTKKDPDKIRRMLEALDSSLPVEDDSVCPDTMMKCMAGRSNFWITWYGAMKACAMFPDEVSLENGFAYAWKQTVENSSKIRLPAQCESCSKKSFCRVCAAINKAEEGSFDKVPRFMCKYTDSYIENSRKILSK